MNKLVRISYLFPIMLFLVVIKLYWLIEEKINEIIYSSLVREVPND